MGQNNKRIKELQDEVQSLKTIIKQMNEDNHSFESLDFGWTGNLGRWYWNYQTNEVTFNPLKVMALGYVYEEIPKQVDYQFFTEKLHEDDYERVMSNMLEHLQGKRDAYEVEYRIKKRDGSYLWFYDRGVVTKRDEKNRPLLMAGIVFDITKKKEIEEELKAKNKYLEELAIKDPLTGICNHRSLYSQLNHLLTGKKVFDTLAVVMLDLDNFKKVNDTHGHVFGDEVLKQFSSIVLKHIPNSSVFGRYGGEEFMLICLNQTSDEILNCCNRIREEFKNYYLTETTNISVSGGIEFYDNQTLYQLIDNADQKLYVAKRNGKDQFII